MLPHFYKDLGCLFLFICLLLLSTSCANNEEPRKVLDFQVCKIEELPDELIGIIEERKEKPFSIVYEGGAFMYIVEGYGKQQTEEFAVAVHSLEETEETIYVDFILLHASKKGNRKSAEASRFPYIVLRLEKNEKEVLFQSPSS